MANIRSIVFTFTGKVRTGALAKTHPPFMSRPEIEEEKSVARDDNNFPFAPYSHRRIEVGDLVESEIICSVYVFVVLIPSLVSLVTGS